jgi:hypothetical protein
MGSWSNTAIRHQALSTPDKRGRNAWGIARIPNFLLLPHRCKFHAANRNGIAPTGLAPVDVKARAA